MEKLQPSAGKTKTVQQLRKTVWQLLKRNKSYHINLAILLLSACPREMKTWPHKKLYMNVWSSIMYNSQKVGLQTFTN